MERIERDLMWAYEQVSSGVLARPMAGRDVSGQAADLYSGVDSAARLLSYVSRLPAAQLTAVEAKCGLLPDALNLCARRLAAHFRLPETAARALVLCWLDHESRPKISQLADLLNASESTAKRRMREARRLLEDDYQKALGNLGESVEGYREPMYNRFC